jgi:lipopolysaccharide/colanic/teichoic acid biosynthesis glycosyltransferase
MEAALTQHPGVTRTSSLTGQKYQQRPRRREVTAEKTIHLVPVASADLRLERRNFERTADVLPRERSELASRVVNFVIAAVALIAVAPLMAIVGLLVKLTSPGPAFYSQTRVGVDRRWRQRNTDDRRKHDHGGVPFEMYKFRSMRTDAEADGKAVWAQKKDPRVTPIGGFLRKTRLDELPQLYNVLRGDMNIVGPRPERPTIFAELRENIPEYQMRQRVKPGITGWAQINQAYDSCVDDVRSKVSYDLEYLRRQSLGLDLRIMSMTIPVMLLRRGGW